MAPAPRFEDQFREPTKASQPSACVSTVDSHIKGGSRRSHGSHGIDPNPSNPLHPDTHWFHHGDIARGIVASFHAFYEEPWMNFGEIPTVVRDHFVYLGFLVGLPRQTTHTQGCVSILVVVERIKDLKRKATVFEIFAETHKNIHFWSDSLSIQSRRSTRLWIRRPPSSRFPDIYRGGQAKKRRVYGIESAQKVLTHQQAMEQMQAQIDFLMTYMDVNPDSNCLADAGSDVPRFSPSPHD
ncbi:hypothetical protein AKJ16_DCAP09626 [Drosera capensis]